MAEHVLTLKAKLDDSEVRSKVNQLNQNGGGSSGSSKDIDQLSNSLKNLKRIIGGGALANSFLSLADSIKLFGDEGDKTAQRIKGAAGRMMAAIGSGNPAIIATTGLFEILAYQASKLNDQLEKSKKDLEELQSRIAKFNDLRAAAEKRDQSRADAKFLEEASNRQLAKEILGIREERAKKLMLRDEELEKGGTLGFDAEKVKKLNEEIAELDSTFDLFNNTLKRRLEQQSHDRFEDEERTRKFKQARLDYDFQQAAKTALKNGDIDFFRKGILDAEELMAQGKGANIQEYWERGKSQRELMLSYKEQLEKKQADEAEKEKKREESLQKAKDNYQRQNNNLIAEANKDIGYFVTQIETATKQMSEATTAEDFNYGASIRDYAIKQIQSINQSTLADAWKNLTTGSVSNYSALGFSMGETLSPISDIEKQIDQIIRLMENQMKQSVQYVNPQYTL